MDAPDLDALPPMSRGECDRFDLRCRASSGSRDDGCPKRPESLDPEDDLVARLEISAERGVANLEQAARPDRPASDKVARAEPSVGRCAPEHLPERELGI